MRWYLNLGLIYPLIYLLPQCGYHHSSAINRVYLIRFHYLKRHFPSRLMGEKRDSPLNPRLAHPLSNDWNQRNLLSLLCLIIRLAWLAHKGECSFCLNQRSHPIARHLSSVMNPLNVPYHLGRQVLIRWWWLRRVYRLHSNQHGCEGYDPSHPRHQQLLRDNSINRPWVWYRHR